MFQGSVLFAISQGLVLLVLTHFGGKIETGKYVLATSVTAPIFMLFELMLRVTRATDHQYGEQFRNYLGLRATCLLLAFVTTIIVGIVFYRVEFWIIFAILIYRMGDSLSNLSFGGFQRMQASDQVGKSLTIKAIIAIFLSTFVAWISGGSAFMVAIAMASIACVWGTAWDLPKSWALNEPDLPLNLGQVRASIADYKSNFRIAKRALPLGFDAFISSLAMNMPKYFIDHYFGKAALGVFGLLSQLALAVQLLIGAVGHTGVGMLAARFQSGDRVGYWRLFNKMLASSIVVGILAIVVGTIVFPPVLGYFLGPTHNDAMLIMCLLIASCLVGAQRTAGRATQASGSYLWYMTFDIVNFVTSVICSYFLIEKYGLIGGACVLIATFGAGLLVTLLHTYGISWRADQRAMRSAETAVES